MRRHRAAGFTLIEVMIALAIVGIALGAVLGLAGQSARVAGHLETRTTALWVASNLSAEIELAGVPPTQPRRGEREMLGRRWFWLQATEPTADPAIARVRTRVFASAEARDGAGDPVAALVTFLVRT